MRLISVLLVAACLPLAACSGGPKDEDVVLGMRGWGATNGKNFEGVKNLGCEKTTDGEVKDSGVFYRCRVESTAGGKTYKDSVFFQQVGDKWLFRGN